MLYIWNYICTKKHRKMLNLNDICRDKGQQGQKLSIERTQGCDKSKISRNLYFLNSRNYGKTEFFYCEI